MRSRNLKPGFFTNEQLAECEPLARILFAGLWCMADRDGRLEDRPKRIKATVLPFDECSVEALLTQLYERAFILRYEVGGLRVIAIPNFKKHARPHPDERSDDLPDVPEDFTGFHGISGKHSATCALPSSSLNPSSLNPSSLNNAEPVRSGSASTVPTAAAAAGKKRSNPKTNGGAPPPGDLDPTVLTFPCSGPSASPREWCLRESKVREYAEAFPAVDVLGECRKALQWCRDNPPKRKTHRGMAAFLTRWLTTAQDRGANGKAIPRSSSGGGESVEEKIARLREKKP